MDIIHLQADPGMINHSSGSFLLDAKLKTIPNFNREPLLCQ